MPEVKRFGNAVPERVIFLQCQEYANETEKSFVGWFDDDGSYVLTPISEYDLESPEYGYHWIYHPNN